MNCKPIYCHLEFCLECDKVTPFIDWVCLYCGCDTPFGNYDDDDRPSEQDDEYNSEMIKIGDLREASKDIQEIFEKYYPVKLKTNQ
ncbi:hypothetical protein HHL23_09380 [Chryseobacterium sp. RP-3-3]|uniref:Uncharacterized protein n=1 Tax=Chryseobacterium antibioticum TaxID=2728847 RepID=A0A7Y0AME9_9FLAO|nr:hypothetical protein [Chryseobacterium antibioticum]NML70011.1 hypothetical protein [Chryseobacterium antibioticum]